jgi:hypothetical protein
MHTFIERQNIVRFVGLLKSETDPTKRELLQMLLAEEQMKQANHVEAQKVALAGPSDFS